ncbi:MAG: aminotransferase class V-fold PLP-dependent enzyme [Clostridia bacterium]|nr:aminotransferase class V-fold PLP-dependent enzyme [Clostridia bacterium]
MHYFDNAATTFPKPNEVYEYMDSFYRQYGVNVGRGQFKESSIAYAMMQETRQLLLDLFHVRYPYEVVFTPSATQALNTIINSITFKTGDVVYITPFEHNAVLRTLYAKQKENGFGINILPIEEKTLQIDIEKTRILFEKSIPNYCFLTHASNSFGCVLQVEEICKLAKSYGAVNIIDMAQTAGLVDISLNNSNIDYAVFAGHKTLYGPFGIAGIITKNAKDLKPFLIGGTGFDSKNMEMPEQIPLKFEAGSANIQAIAGLNAALKWIKVIGINNIRAKEKETTQKLLDVIKNHSNISIVRGEIEDNNIGVISCVFAGYSSDNIGQVLSEKGIAVRTGLHCAPKGHEVLKTSPDGTVRFSISYFTSDRDIQALETVLDYIEMEG